MAAFFVLLRDPLLSRPHLKEIQVLLLQSGLLRRATEGLVLDR